MERKFKPGTRYGRLTIIEPTERRMGRAIIYKCICDCGNECFVASSNLGKSTNSCGCLEIENRITHNKSKTKLYDVWINMKQRCNNPNNPRYKNYGGRGIKVCDEWNDFENFYNWAIVQGYNESLNKKEKMCTLDRKDVDGDYTPSNCRWITNKQQQNNKTDTVYYEYQGETHTISEWADILGLPLDNLKGRLSKGWDIKRVLEQPIKKSDGKIYISCAMRGRYDENGKVNQHLEPNDEFANCITSVEKDSMVLEVGIAL